MAQIIIHVTEEQKAELQALAAQYDLMYGGRGGLKKLFTAIADRELLIQSPPSEVEQGAWLQCLKDAIEAGHIDAAQKLALQLRRFPLLDEMGEAIEDWLEVGSWGPIEQLYEFIEKRQPFALSYNDSEGNDVLYTVNYAHLEYIERHRYLVARVTVPADNPEHPDLAYNRCFRLDRILAIVPLDYELEWQKLGTTPVTFQLKGNWTKKYERKLGDSQLTWIIPPGGEDEAVLQVTRQVWSFFWFLREVDRYQKIEIISPEILREQHITLLKIKLGVYHCFLYFTLLVDLLNLIGG